MEKAVIYARYSSDRQTEQSIEGQVRECKKFADSKGYTIIGEYVDRALTGKIDKRPDFQRMIKDSQKRLFNYVIVYQLDRFARSKYDSAHYKHILKRNNVRVLSAKENITDDPSGILMETMLEGMAEYYSAELSVKVKRGLYESFMKGNSTGSGCYGFTMVTTDPNNKMCKSKRYEINKDEATIIRKIFADYAGGKTMREISEWLNANDIKNRRGQHFHENSIMHLLKNKKFIGTLSFDGEVRENAIPAIIDKKLFDEVQVRIDKNKRNRSAYKAPERYLLSSKTYCGYCHKPIRSDSTNKANGNIYRWYACFTKKHLGQPCEKKAVNKKWLEDLVINETMKLLLQDGMIEKISQQVIGYNAQRRATPNLEKLELQLAETEKKLKSLVTALENGIFSETTKARFLELESDKADILWRIDGEKMNVPIKLVYDEVVFWFVQFTQGDINDEKFRERIIDTFINKIILWNDKILITYNIKGTDGNRLTVEEIVKDFETEQQKFDLSQFGARDGNRTHASSLEG